MISVAAVVGLAVTMIALCIIYYIVKSTFTNLGIKLR